MGKYIFIKPEDTLFFRDGRPFERGIESFARSVFPPYPSVFYGAIRTASILANATLFSYTNNESLKNAVGDESKLGALEIGGPFIRHEDGQVFVPLPFDVLMQDNGDLFKVSPKDCDFCSNLPFSIRFATPSEGKEGKYEEYFVNLADLIEYYLFRFDNRVIKTSLKEVGKIFGFEYKVGIKTNRVSGTAQEHYLYSAAHIRMRDGYGFLVYVENDGGFLPDEGDLRLGGDARTAHFQKLEGELLLSLREKIKSSVTGKYLKFVLLTPAVFEKGWYPDFLNAENGSLKGHFNGLTLQLASAVLGKPVYCGGFDIKRKHPKAMKRAVPAGSVYFFEVTESNGNSLNDFAARNSFTSVETNDYYKKQGFGIALIGGGQDE